MPRLCESTQNIPAPQGPRRPVCARYRTAPPALDRNPRKIIPVDQFGNVLRDPGYYCNEYPDVLPITRKLYQQLCARRTALERSEAEMSAQATRLPTPTYGGEGPGIPNTTSEGFYEPLTTAGDEIVRSEDRESKKDRMLPPPIGHEAKARRYGPEPDGYTPAGPGTIGDGRKFKREYVDQGCMTVVSEERPMIDFVERGELSQCESADFMDCDLEVGGTMVLTGEGEWAYQTFSASFAVR